MQIIIDTREKKDIFLFSSYGVETVVKKLDTGDYSIEGFEDKITIDRKRTSSELQMCLFSQYDRFEKELIRMSSFDEAYILCSFPYSYLYTFPQNSSMPKRIMRKFRGGAAYLRKKLHEVNEEYPYVKFIYSDDQVDAEYRAYNLLKNYYESHTNTEN